jgi:hypothetical protein
MHARNSARHVCPMLAADAQIAVAGIQACYNCAFMVEAAAVTQQLPWLQCFNVKQTQAGMQAAYLPRCVLQASRAEQLPPSPSWRQ